MIPVKIGRSKLCARDLADKVDACQGEAQIILTMIMMRIAMLRMTILRIKNVEDDNVDCDNVEDGITNDDVLFVVLWLPCCKLYDMFQETAGVLS